MPQETNKFTTPSNVTVFYDGVLTRKQCKTRSTTPPVMEKPKCPDAPKKKRKI